MPGNRSDTIDVNKRVRQSLCLFLLLTVTGLVQARDVYMDPAEFVRSSFAGDPPAPDSIWLDKELKSGIRDIMGHDLGVLRLRYWQRDGRTAWILEEIGKEKPITTGIVVDGGEIERLKVLIYRETRGWEVRYPFFTDQFQGTELTERRRLDKDIDGISGATLSVNALEKLARLALYLHDRTQNGEHKGLASN